MDQILASFSNIWESTGAIEAIEQRTWKKNSLRRCCLFRRKKFQSVSLPIQDQLKNELQLEFEPMTFEISAGRDWWSWLWQQPPASPWAWFNLEEPEHSEIKWKLYILWTPRNKQRKFARKCNIYVCWLWPNSYLQANNSGNCIECKLHEPQTVLFGALNSPRRISEQIWK